MTNQYSTHKISINIFVYKCFYVSVWMKHKRLLPAFSVRIPHFHIFGKKFFLKNFMQSLEGILARVFIGFLLQKIGTYFMTIHQVKHRH